jgi:hypothetical protein
MSKKSTTPAADQTARMATLAFAAFVVIAIVALIVMSISHRNPPSAVSASPSPGATATASPGPRETPGLFFKSQGHQGHDKKGPDDKGVSTFRYSSDPPTSGMHLEQFSPELISMQSLPKYMQVHLLEHGNVLLQYSCQCPDIAGALAQLAAEYNNRQLPPGATGFTADLTQGVEERGTGVIVAPYPGMKHKIALTAWTRLEWLDAFDQATIIRFINAYLANQANSTQ